MLTKIFIQSGLLPDIAVVTVDGNASEEAITALCLAAIPQSARDTSLELFDEDDTGDDETGPQGSAHRSGHPRHVHISRCKKVGVKVRYAGRVAEGRFSPATTIAKVKRWAVRQLGIAAPDAVELTLQLAGSDQQPAPDRHVGCYARDCEVVFDLVRSYTVNGDSTLSSDQAALLRDLDAPLFQVGVAAGRWALRAMDWPFPQFDVRGAGGSLYTLRLRCDEYPKLPPTGTFWDPDKGVPLPIDRWPKSTPGRGQALRTDWQGGSALYIPCDRNAISGHDQWRQLYPAWQWDPSVGITRYLNVVSSLLRTDC